MLIVEFMPQSIRARRRFLKSGEIDVLLDTSGFGYGDFWGLRKLRQRLTGRLANWKRPGRIAVLLPQAFGPFDSPGMADAMRNALDNCDLAFARDRLSAGYLRRLTTDPGKVREAPDFTNLLAPALPDKHRWAHNATLIVPNSKMAETEASSRRYAQFLLRVVAKLRSSGREPVILLHERNCDRAVADALNSSLDDELKIIEPENSLATKAIIARAELIVSSRFHGLVSALSSGVPALATGWTHKYQALLADYGCEDFLADISAPESWDAVIDKFLASAVDPAFRQMLARNADHEKTKSREMWDRVFKTISDARC